MRRKFSPRETQALPGYLKFKLWTHVLFTYRVLINRTLIYCTNQNVKSKKKTKLINLLSVFYSQITWSIAMSWNKNRTCLKNGVKKRQKQPTTCLNFPGVYTSVFILNTISFTNWLYFKNEKSVIKLQCLERKSNTLIFHLLSMNIDNLYKLKFTTYMIFDKNLFLLKTYL